MVNGAAQANPHPPRWRNFCQWFVLLYTLACLLSATNGGEVFCNYVAAFLQLRLIYRLGRLPRDLPDTAYSISLPLTLLAQIYATSFAQGAHFVFPWVQFLLTWFLLQFPVILWGRRKVASSATMPLLPILYLMTLFCFDFWRIPSAYSADDFVHHGAAPGYLWMCVILPQFICCSPAIRRAIRVLLTRVNWRRTMAGVAIGMASMTAWIFLAGVLFGNVGQGASVYMLGTDVPRSDYSSLLLVLKDHFLVIIGYYVFAAWGEEFCFRLLLPGFLRARLREAGRESFWTPLLLSAFMFGLIHWQQGAPSWTKILYSCASGLVFAAVQRYSRNMQASTLAHAITDDLPRLIWR